MFVEHRKEFELIGDKSLINEICFYPRIFSDRTDALFSFHFTRPIWLNAVGDGLIEGIVIPAWAGFIQGPVVCDEPTPWSLDFWYDISSVTFDQLEAFVLHIFNTLAEREIPLAPVKVTDQRPYF